MAIALGIDFEDITHTPAYRGLADPGETSVDLVALTGDLLDLFDRFGVTVTFFIVAEFAETHPEAVQRIAAHGHEIASHTLSHRSLVGLDSETRAEELGRSKEILEEITGNRVWGIRAPTCQIDDSVYRSLVSEGYEYSSSVMPSLPIPGFYSNEYAFSDATKVSTGAGDVMEIPLTVHPILRLPLSGAWIRILGRTYAHQGIRSVLGSGADVVTYSHPWEFTDLWETPLPFRNRIRTGHWITETYESILDLDAEFCTVADLVDRTNPAREYLLTP